MNASNAARIANLSALNPSQYGAISTFLSFALINQDDYEVKEGSVNHLYGTKGGEHYALSITVGRKGDEGTLGEAIGRDHYHLFIGPRGKLTAKYAPRFLQQFRGRSALGVHYASDCQFRVI